MWRKTDALRVTAIPLGRQLPGASSNLPGRQDPDIDPGLSALARRQLCAVPIRSCSRWGLPCRLRCRRRGALLPHPFTLTAPAPHPSASEGMGGARRSALCGTFPRLAPAGRYPAPYVHGARTFLPGHLSVLAGAAVQPTDAAVNGHTGRPRQGLRRVVTRARKSPYEKSGIGWAAIASRRG